MLVSISKMKTLLSPSLLSPSLHLPQSKPLTLVPLASSSIFSKASFFRNLRLLPKKTDTYSARRSCFAIPTPSRKLHTVASQSSSSGEIHVILGPMFAGKTTKLLHRMESESKNGRSIAILKSNKDTRYDVNAIVTHDGDKLPCWTLANLTSFKQKFGSDAYDQLDVIGIDEAQFFGDLYDFCREAADRDGKTVIVAGLDGDYLRRSFGLVLDLIPLADTVTKLHARCELCGKRALFTLRKTEETKTEVIGGAEVYMPVCRHHYVSGHGVVEAARDFLESQTRECGSYL